MASSVWAKRSPPLLTTLWARLTVLTRHPSSVTDKEKIALTSMATEANLLGAGEQLTDPVVIAVLKAHMPLWEAMVESAATLPWLADGAKGPFPCVGSVAAVLRDHGHMFPHFVNGLFLATKISILVRVINEASARSAVSWPLVSSVCALGPRDAGVGGHNDHACLLTVVDMGIRYAFLAFMPFIDPSGRTAMAVCCTAPTTADRPDMVHRDELVNAVVARSAAHPVCTDPKRAGAAL
ncbi:hypothetical protein psal_cds_758 [Pandoravirus salinus]|uniref:Uncharacterized protein n=1 Tax=Pandoravirus salinus TaxID=1349410 RepID=S4W3B9_9VIRU|nr:hypothetical protein psal_cds_758 [Pandoravirus salinus]AGO84750.1 hypothetical protein psal_cds_758 [Pandoravirus salinus]